MFEYLPRTLESLKDIKGFRFYFLSLIVSLLILIALFKGDITTVINKKDEVVEHRKVRDLNGLEAVLKSLYDTKKHSNYLVYIYQPKTDAIIKILEPISLVHNIINPSKLHNTPLDEQPTLNTVFRYTNYTLLSKDDPKPDMEYLHHLGLNYILVVELEYYSAKDKSYITVGEIHFSYHELPDQKEIDMMLKELTSVTNKYVI